MSDDSNVMVNVWFKYDDNYNREMAITRTNNDITIKDFQMSNTMETNLENLGRFIFAYENGHNGMINENISFLKHFNFEHLKEFYLTFMKDEFKMMIDSVENFDDMEKIRTRLENYPASLLSFFHNNMNNRGKNNV